MECSGGGRGGVLLVCYRFSHTEISGQHPGRPGLTLGIRLFRISRLVGILIQKFRPTIVNALMIIRRRKKRKLENKKQTVALLDAFISEFFVSEDSS